MKPPPANDLIGEYYDPDRSPTEGAFRQGVFFRAPIHHVDPQQTFVRLMYTDPEGKRPPAFQLTRKDSDAYKHQPLNYRDLQLRDDEAFVAVRSKLRPVILFSSPLENWRLVGGERPEEAFVCLPTYGLDEYDEPFRLAVQAFKYASLFYLPEDGRFGRKEAFIRFDRMQVVPKQQLVRLEPHHQLTENALYLLQEWFGYYLTGTASDWVLEYQAQQMERLSQAQRDPEDQAPQSLPP
jgi:hypothetical protein